MNPNTFSDNLRRFRKFLIPFILFEVFGGIVSNSIYDRILTPFLGELPAYSLLINILAFLTGTTLFIAVLSIQSFLREYDYREHFQGIDREQVDEINDLLRQLLSRRSRVVLEGPRSLLEQLTTDIHYYRAEMQRIEERMRRRRNRSD